MNTEHYFVVKGFTITDRDGVQHIHFTHDYEATLAKFPDGVVYDMDKDEWQSVATIDKSIQLLDDEITAHLCDLIEAKEKMYA